MGNIWVNLEFGDSGFAPYLGGGIGAMRIETNDVSVIGFDLSDESDTVGAGQLGAGIGYRLTDNFSVSCDHRFLMSEDPEFADVEAENQNHSLSLGLRYRFLPVLSTQRTRQSLPQRMISAVQSEEHPSELQ